MSGVHSQQLITLMTQSGKTPQSRLLSLFDLLNDTLNTLPPHASIATDTIFNPALTLFCTEQAKTCGATNAAILAEHIVLIAQNAFNQQISHPDIQHLSHAKKAANALILAQTTQQFRLLNYVNLNHVNAQAARYAIGVGALSLVCAALFLPALIQHFQPAHLFAYNTIQTANANTLTRDATATLTANEAAQMYAKFETMRNGTCQFPEAIQIPDKDKAVYLESVVGGKLPTNLGDLAIANAYLEKVRCNYTPMLMRASK